MNIDSLKTFCVLYETTNFTRTAEKLNITEATVSYRIKEVERYLGKDLLIRNRDKSISFTETGRRFYEEAIGIMESLDKIKRKDQNMPLKGRIKVSSGEVAGIYFLASAVKDFNDRHHNVEIRLDFCSALETLNRLQRKEIDLGFTSSLSFKSHSKFLSNVKITKLFPIKMGVIARVGDSLLNYKEIEIQKIIGKPYVARSDTSAIQAETEKIFESSNISKSDLNVIYTFQNSSSVISAVAEGLGISICSDIQANKYVHGGLIGFVPIKSNVKSYIHMIDRHNGENQLVNLFSSYLKKYLNLDQKTSVI